MHMAFEVEESPGRRRGEKEDVDTTTAVRLKGTCAAVLPRIGHSAIVLPAASTFQDEEMWQFICCDAI